MIPINHAAVFIRFENRHYHSACLPSDFTLHLNDVFLNMNERANISQCQNIPCYTCKTPITMFPDRTEVTIKQWPDQTMPTIEHAHLLANSAIGKTAIFDDVDYIILHAEVIPPTSPNGKGQIVALCEALPEEEDEESAPTPAHEHLLARERFTPGPWHVDPQNPYTVLSTQPPSGVTICAVANPINAPFIAEAPSMFALLKQCIHAGCTCPDCSAAQRLIDRVLEVK